MESDRLQGTGREKESGGGEGMGGGSRSRDGRRFSGGIVLGQPEETGGKEPHGELHQSK